MAPEESLRGFFSIVFCIVIDRKNVELGRIRAIYRQVTRLTAKSATKHGDKFFWRGGRPLEARQELAKQFGEFFHAASVDPKRGLDNVFDSVILI